MGPTFRVQTDLTGQCNRILLLPFSSRSAERLQGAEDLPLGSQEPELQGATSERNIKEAGGEVGLKIPARSWDRFGAVLREVTERAREQTQEHIM